MQGVYLSIDLDYWVFTAAHWPVAPFLKMLRRVSAPPAKWRVVTLHHRLLPHINRSLARTLINLDWHDDIADLDDGHLPELNDGTWVTHVRWRREGRFEWIPPTQACARGETGSRCFAGLGPDPFLVYPQWKRCSKSTTARIPWERVVDVGIAISPDWSSGKGCAAMARALYDLCGKRSLCLAARWLKLGKYPGRKG